MITRTRTKWKPKGIVFAVAPQTIEWLAMEERLRLLPDTDKIVLEKVTDGTIEGIEFSRCGHSYAIFNSLLWEPTQKAEFWFFVWEKDAPESALDEIVWHFETMLNYPVHSRPNRTRETRSPS